MRISHLAGPILLLAALISATDATEIESKPREAKLVSSSSSSGWILDGAQQQAAADKSAGVQPLDEDQAIVLNSVHSGLLQQQHHYQPAPNAVRPGSGNAGAAYSNSYRPNAQVHLQRPNSFAIKREPPSRHHNSASSQNFSLPSLQQWNPSAGLDRLSQASPTSGGSAAIEHQEARSGTQHRAPLGANQQQPSQEFDSQSMVPRSGAVSHQRQFQQSQVPAQYGPATRWPPAADSGASKLPVAFAEQVAGPSIQQHKPFRDYHGISAAPYAVQSQHHQQSNHIGHKSNQFGGAANTLQQFANLSNHQQEESTENHHHLATGGSLIRDTSELNQANLLAGEQQNERDWPQATLHHQQSPDTAMSGSSIMWAQSVRDNHHGQIRSRFNLSSMASSLFSASMSALTEDHSNEMVVPVAGGGSAQPYESQQMRGKLGGLHHGSAMVPYEQQLQAKSVRTSQQQQPQTAANLNPIDADSNPIGSITGPDNGISSRRNSKFTRQSVETTTPLSSTPLNKLSTESAKVTSNRHAAPPAAGNSRPNAGLQQSVNGSSTTSTSATVPPLSSDPPTRTTTDEPATGSGHVIALNETDLVRLGQKFALESLSNKTTNFIDDLGQAEQLAKRTGDKLPDHNQQEEGMVQLMSNHHRGKLQKMTLNNTLDEQRIRLSSSQATSVAASTIRPSSINKHIEEQDNSTAGDQILMSNNHSIRGQAPASTLPRAVQNSFRTVSSSAKSPVGHKTGRGMLFTANDGNEEVVSRRQTSPLPGSGELRTGPGLATTTTTITNNGGQQSRTWTRLLPALIQRTIGGMLRRLTGGGDQSQKQQQQLQPQYLQSNLMAASSNLQGQRHVDQTSGNLFEANSGPTMVKFPAESSQAALGGFSFITSALAAAANLPNRPHQSQLGGFEQALDSGAHLTKSSMKQLQMASNQEIVQQPPRQHANKKIIDSFVDLPVSERRQSLDKRTGDVLFGSINETSTAPEADQPKDLGNLQLSSNEKPTNGRAGDGSIVTGADRLQDKAVQRRNSKTTAEWKQHDSRKRNGRVGSRRSSDELKSLSRMSVASAPPAAEESDDDYELLGRDRDESDGKAERSELSAKLVSAAESGRPIEELHENEDEAGTDEEDAASSDVDISPSTNLSDESASEIDSLDSADSLVIEDAKLQDDTTGSQESADWQSGDATDKQPMAGAIEPASDFETNLETKGQAVDLHYHGPVEAEADSETGPSYRELNQSRKPIPKRASLRQPPEAPPIEPVEVEEESEPRLITARNRPVRRRKPVEPVQLRRPIRPNSAPANLGNQQKRRRPPASAPPQVSLVAAKRATVHGQIGGASSPAIKPLSIFALPPPNSDGGDREGADTSNMMSPMSSSINVMDLDPSMTRLAHNKLIVAKFKPRNKFKIALSGVHRTSKPLLAEGRESSPIGSTSGTDSVAPPATSHRVVQASSPSSQSASQVAAKARKPPALVDPTLASLTSAILGTQVITNNHINDIMRRWSRPQQTNPTGTSTSGQQVAGTILQADGRGIESGQVNSSRWLSSMDGNSANLRIVNDLQSLVASGLAARFSFPSGARAALSTSTTSTTPRPRPSDHHVSSAGGQSQQGDAGSQQPASGASLGPFKSDKFNFSLIQMNNRERVNPLLFPVEHPIHRQQAALNQTQNKRAQMAGSRTRPTTTTSTFRPPTRPSSTMTTSQSSPSGSSTTTLRPNSELPTRQQVASTSPSTIGGHQNELAVQHTPPTSTRNPNRNPGTRLPATPSRRPNPQQTGSHKQATSESVANDELAPGQILRSQHNMKPTSRLPLTESDRLRNQYFALLGKNTSLDARDSAANVTTLTAIGSEASLSGHITLPTSNLFVSSIDERLPSGVAVEEAARDANRYTIASSPVGVPDDNDHSIVIMSDNHHQTRRRPSHSGPVGRRPPLGASTMLYSSQTPVMESPTTLAPALSDATRSGSASPTLSSAQISRKFLEEFVNGSRLRPSSAASAKMTTTSPPIKNEPQSSHPSKLISADHLPTKVLEQSGLPETPIRRFHTDRLLPSGSRNMTAFNSVNGAPLPDSSGLMVEKLDQKAQELLLEMFDRDPSYSMSGDFSNQIGSSLGEEQQQLFIASANQKQQATNSQNQPIEATTTLATIGEHSEGEQYQASAENGQVVASFMNNTTTTSEGIREQQPVINGTQQQLNYDFKDLKADRQPQRAGNQQSSHEISVDGVDLRPTELFGNLDLTTTTQVSGGEPSAASVTTASPFDDSEMNARGDQNPSEMHHLPGNGGEDSNNRASMRKNQAKIQAILAALSKKNKNSAQTTSTTTEEPDLEVATDQEMTASNQYPTTTFDPLSTGASSPKSSGDSRDISSESGDSDMDGPGDSQETTRFYAPMKLTTLPANLQSINEQRRYPNVETVSSSRQKINRPVAQTSFGHNNQPDSSLMDHSTFVMGTSTSPMPSVVTTKLTESPTNDADFKQVIKNRVGVESVAATEAQTETRYRPTGSTTELAFAFNEVDSNGSGDFRDPPTASESDDEQQLGNRGSINGHRWPEDKDKDRHGEESSGYSSEGSGAGVEPDRIAYGQADESNYQLRPVIKRNKPRPSSTRMPQRITMAFHGADQRKRLPNRAVLKKRHRKPPKRPSGQPLALNTDDNSARNISSILLEVDGSDEPLLNLSNGKHRRSTRRPGQSNSPPKRIQIHEPHFGGSHQNKTMIINRRPGGSQNDNPQDVYLIVNTPFASPIKRKHQDIRTKPLNVIDPMTESPPDTSNDSVVNPGTWTRIPETTIMHNNMVVTYKPGRPLPGANSGFGSIGQVTPDFTRPYRENGSTSGDLTTSGPFSGATSQEDSTFAGNNGSEMGPGSGTPSIRPQLGSGNGGDTHLVSIEQQQQAAALQSTRRPFVPTMIDQSSSSSSSSATIPSSEPPATTTSTATTPAQPAPSLNPQRQTVIVISGLPLSGNDMQPHQSVIHKPTRPNGSTLVEAGSMSVLSQASHGQNPVSHNSSKPWYPTSPGHQGGRFPNSTSLNNSTIGSDSSVSSDFSSSSSSNQTADAIVGPEFPNFAGSPSSSGSGTGPSGSYQNHHHQQQQQQLIGMPYLGPGGSLSGANRPSTARPYRWRVIRRKPGGGSNGTSSNAPYDYSSASSVSSHVYRPVNGLFSIHSLGTIYENVVIFFARIRTFLISMMVMFLPPLALAASVVNVMSS